MGVEEGIFEPQGFFSYKIPFMNIFLRINWRAGIFFHLIFPCAKIFFSLPPHHPPARHKFSNGPSLTEMNKARSFIYTGFCTEVFIRKNSQPHYREPRSGNRASPHSYEHVKILQNI